MNVYSINFCQFIELIFFLPSIVIVLYNPLREIETPRFVNILIYNLYLIRKVYTILIYFINSNVIKKNSVKRQHR